MACQLALSDDLAPRRKALHLVSKGPRLPKAEALTLPFGPREASVFTIPWPVTEERRKRVVVEHNSHACGISRHFWSCINNTRCTLPYKAPCSACEDEIRASYRPGRFAVAR